jgi:hypothetical protein
VDALWGRLEPSVRDTLARRDGKMTGMSETSSTPTDDLPTAEEVRAELCGPGGPFEVVTEVVGGVEM